MTDRLNRVLLTLLGIALAAAGVVGLLVRQGALWPDARQPGELVGEGFEWAEDRPGWASVLTIGIAVVVIAVVLLWLWVQLRSALHRGPGRLRLEAQGPGRTEVDTLSVARAVAHDMERVPGVVSSKVRLSSLRPTVQATARLDLVERVVVSDIVAGVEPVVQRLRQAVGASGAQAEIRLRLATEERARVI